MSQAWKPLHETPNASQSHDTPSPPRCFAMMANHKGCPSRSKPRLFGDIALRFEFYHFSAQAGDLQLLRLHLAVARKAATGSLSKSAIDLRNTVFCTRRSQAACATFTPRSRLMFTVKLELATVLP